MYDLVIKNGHLVAADGVFHADLAIVGESIAAIGVDLAGGREIDAAGCYVLPGGVDPHVHLQMALDGRVSTDTFETGTIAAVCGGTTTIVDFADPQPEQSMMEALAARRREADSHVAIDYGLHMTVPAWHGASQERLQEVPEVVAAGCVTFKLYQAYERVALDDVSLYRVLGAVGAAGGRAVLHSEVGPVLAQLRDEAVADGHTTPIWHERTRPARLEATAIHRAAELAFQAECPLYIFHVGNTEAVAEIVAARLRGVDIAAETCPQYLLLTADEHLKGRQGRLYICAPPLRSAEDQDALWLALADDDLQVVSTDHCPWTRAEKDQLSFAQVPGGLPGIEVRLSLLHHFGVGEGRLTPQRWVQLCCTNPARLMGLSRKGALLPGYDADLIVFDPEREKTIDVETLHGAADWTPYADLTLYGWPRTVLLRGQVVVADEEYVGQPGDGRFLVRG